MRLDATAGSSREAMLIVMCGCIVGEGGSGGGIGGSGGDMENRYWFDMLRGTLIAVSVVCKALSLGAFSSFHTIHFAVTRGTTLHV